MKSTEGIAYSEIPLRADASKARRARTKETPALRQRGPRRVALRCRVCGEATRHGKPYCTAHIARMPYVQSLLLREGWSEVVAAFNALDALEQTLGGGE